jgi:hypothetical protein
MSAISSNKEMTYKETINRVDEKLRILNLKYRVSPKEASWVYEAIDLTRDLINAEQLGISQSEYFQKEELLYDKTLTSLAELINIREILESINIISVNNLEIFLHKLKEVFNAPLLIRDETYNSSHGRNTMFELRLFSKLIQRDYETYLSNDHPDLLVMENGNNYFIECKRIFKKETFITNIKAAIDQLEKFSLNRLGYGIVALSATRYFHTGDKRLEAHTELAAKKRIEFEMDELINEHNDELFNLFPFKIPALLLEFSDRVAADKAYSMTLIDIINTSNGRASMFYKIQKDFKRLTIK